MVRFRVVLAFIAAFGGWGACAPSGIVALEAHPPYRHRGIAQIEEIEGGNRLLAIEIEDLRPAPAGSVYVIWLIRRNEAHNAGVLDYDARRRLGAFLSSTPWRSFGVKITNELNPLASRPSDQIVAVGHFPE